MGLFGGIAGLMSGGRSGSGSGDPARALLGGGIMDIMRAASGGKGKKSSGDKPPVDNSHSHGSSGNTSTKQGSGGNDPILEAGLGQNAGGPPPVPNGIDNGQYEQEFMEKRGGVGISETPDVQLGAGGQVGVPVPPPDVDKMGVNSLY